MALVYGFYSHNRKYILSPFGLLAHQPGYQQRIQNIVINHDLVGAGLTDVSTNLIETQVFSFHCQWTERTKRESMRDKGSKRKRMGLIHSSQDKYCMCICMSVYAMLYVFTLPVLAEEACQYIKSLQLFSKLNCHRHFTELWCLDSNESLRTLLVVNTETNREWENIQSIKLP